MGRRVPFTIIYDPLVKNHLHAVEKKYYPLIRNTIEEQLTFEPDVETRNRKPLTRETDFDADWELRFGPDNRFRVFYAIDLDSREVLVLAVGVKRGSTLFIAGDEVEL